MFLTKTTKHVPTFLIVCILTVFPFPFRFFFCLLINFIICSTEIYQKKKKTTPFPYIYIWNKIKCHVTWILNLYKSKHVNIFLSSFFSGREKKNIYSLQRKCLQLDCNFYFYWRSLSLLVFIFYFLFFLSTHTIYV